MTTALFGGPRRDNFETESPVRAFTTWDVNGMYAIGKGFRPSLHHLSAYLNAMESKESWRLVQILEAATATPSFVFRKAESVAEALSEIETELSRNIAEDNKRTTDVHQAVARAISGEYDPVNPSHYGGRECADIGERLSANGYQVLKYCWRLGKKDDVAQELSKAIWYASSELALLRFMTCRLINPNTLGLGDETQTKAWFEERIAAQPDFTKKIASVLWGGYDRDDLLRLIAYLEIKQGLSLQDSSGLAI